MQNLSLLAGPMQANKAQDHGNHGDLLLNRTYSLSTSSLPKSNSYNGMMDSAMRVLGRRCTVLLLHHVDRLISSINLPTASIEWPTFRKDTLCSQVVGTWIMSDYFHQQHIMVPLPQNGHIFWIELYFSLPPPPFVLSN